MKKTTAFFRSDRRFTEKAFSMAMSLMIGGALVLSVTACSQEGGDTAKKTSLLFLANKEGSNSESGSGTGSDKGSSPTPGSTPGTTPGSTPGTDSGPGNVQNPGQKATHVYVSGMGNYTTGGYTKYWKDNAPYSVKDIDYPFAIFVDNNDVYLAGNDYDTSKDVAKYCKNGICYFITNKVYESEARSIFVVNQTVYTAGWEKNSAGVKVAKYWVNGNATVLSDGAKDAEATGIFVSNGNVYVSGWDFAPAGGTRAKYWKNGSAVNLTTGSYARANAIYVVGNDVYVAGHYSFKAKYWKNGTMVDISTVNDTHAYSIFVSGNDVYTAGNEAKAGVTWIAKQWKNNTGTSLTDGTYRSEASSTFVHEGDVYTAGIEYNSQGKYMAKYWKNGVAVPLENDQSSNTLTYGIFVVSTTESSAGATLSAIVKNRTVLFIAIGGGAIAMALIAGLWILRRRKAS